MLNSTDALIIIIYTIADWENCFLETKEGLVDLGLLLVTSGSFFAKLLSHEHLKHTKCCDIFPKTVI